MAPAFKLKVATLRGPAVAAVLLAVGCGGQSDTRRVIAGTCVRDGGDAAMCECLGRESLARLDEDGLDAVVFGALGEDVEADRVLNEMGEAGQGRFRAAMAQVLRICDAEAYVSGN